MQFVGAGRAYSVWRTLEKNTKNFSEIYSLCIVLFFLFFKGGGAANGHVLAARGCNE